MYAEQETDVLVKPHSRAEIKIFDGQKSDNERFLWPGLSLVLPIEGLEIIINSP